MKQTDDDMFSFGLRDGSSTGKPINLLKMANPDYFAAEPESKSRTNGQLFRMIHAVTEQMRRMTCSLSFSFELGSLRITLFCGKDFEFSDQLQ